jgi:hypothetical protein
VTDMQSGATTGAQERRFRPRLPDDRFIDRIEVETIPRYKTSGLSGDEWRTHVRVTAFRKGRVVAVKDVGNIAYAQAMMATGDWWTDDEAIPDPRIADDLCDQPGCDQPWTVLYRRKSDGCGHCGTVKDRPNDGWSQNYQAFCERHAKRGDCSLHDADDNYEPVEGAHPLEQVVRPEDESPSVFGGFVVLDDPGEEGRDNRERED